MKCLLGLSVSEIRALLPQDVPAFRAKQLFEWLQKGVEFEDMVNIPKDFRSFLSENFVAQPVKISKAFTSKDGSEKLLYELKDGNVVEGIFMPHSYGNTLCVSTQVGCRMGCAFCASGQNGLIRNLSFNEMLGQVVVCNAKHAKPSEKQRGITNIVLMGSGEPLDNYDETVRFLRSVSAPEGLNISLRNISLSTCGLADRIKNLADEGLSVTLSISLHCCVESVRQKLMPSGKAFSLNAIRSAAIYYFEKTGRRVIFEYALIKDTNCSDADAAALAAFVKGFPSHVNLIRLNSVKESPLRPADAAEVKRFTSELERLGASVTLRRSFGTDIAGACGQLRNKFVGRKEDKN